jgi:hypothetical protein
MLTPTHTRETTLEITPGGHGEPIVVHGRLPSLHDDPQKIHQLLDLLGMPPGTEVRVTTVASSVIVR